MSPYRRIKLPDGSTRDEHRLAMESAIGRRLLRSEVVHHVNGDKRDNRVENLRVMKLSEHSRMHMLAAPNRNSPSGAARRAMSLRYRGEGSTNRKLTNQAVVAILTRLRDGDRASVLAIEFGVSRSCIYRIRNGKRWAHIKAPPH